MTIFSCVIFSGPESRCNGFFISWEALAISSIPNPQGAEAIMQFVLPLK
jgi:hypothetical protein